MMTTTTHRTLPMPSKYDAAKKAARKDSRIVEIVVYPEGWVAKTGGRSIGRKYHFERNASLWWVQTAVSDYSRTLFRDGGGPLWTARDRYGNVLASG